MTHDRRASRRRWLAGAGLFVAGLAVLTLLDRWLFFALRVEDRAALEGRDWYQALRAMGYLPVWLLAGAAIILRDAAGRVPRPFVRGGLVMVVPALAGAMAEALKVVLPRQRPVNNGVGDGEYVWGVPFEALRGVGNHGLASSHAAVAFGGAFVLARLFPGTGFVLVPLALGCGLTRLLTGAHFATDVYVAGWLGLAAAAMLTPRRTAR